VKTNEKLLPAIIELAGNERQQNELKENISRYAIANADEHIAKEILKSIG
jgi:UDP-N-acetylglucosamine:LPS N-acetylglucosamine transferase